VTQIALHRGPPRSNVVVVLTLLAAFGCAGPERPLLAQFFDASRIRDKTALRKMATVVFEPREQGTITTFDIANVAFRRDGQAELKDVTIVAPVLLPSGRTERKTLVVTMQRTATGWIITAVKSELGTL
jgi:hypothetical protein